MTDNTMTKIETYRGGDIYDGGNGGVAYFLRGETFYTDDLEQARDQIDGILDRDLATLPDDIVPVLGAARVEVDIDGNRLEIAAALRKYAERLEAMAH